MTVHITTDDARAALVAGNGRTDVATLLHVALALGASLAAHQTTDQPDTRRTDQ